MPVLRGHGAESPDALRGVTWPDWVADGQAALDDLLIEAERAIVFGHSMGGLVALTLVADNPDRIDSLVVAAPAIQLAAPLAPGRSLYFMAPLVARLVKKWNMPPIYADPDLAQYDTNYAWAPSDAVLSLLRFSAVTRRRLPEIEVPTLILQSHRDTTVAPETVEIVYQGISTAEEQKRVQWLEITEHEMFRDCERETTIGAVVEFVQERIELAAGN
jgi:carboxylesterase